MTEETHRDFMLSSLRAASLRAKMMEVEINSIGIALKGGMVTTDQAVKWLKDIGALDFVGMIPEAIRKGGDGK
jgi:hypothetical protein